MANTPQAFPIRLGITGGMGSGKSVVCHFLKILGHPIYDADTRAKALYIENPSLRSSIIAEFGADAYLADGGLNRRWLADTVFKDQARLEKLNKLVHPLVAQDYKDWLDIHHDKKMVVREAALMFESGAYKQQDYIVNVHAPLELRIKRILARDPQRNRAEIEAIIGKQMSDEEKNNRSDFVILNDESTLLVPQILAILERIEVN